MYRSPSLQPSLCMGCCGRTGREMEANVPSPKSTLTTSGICTWREGKLNKACYRPYRNQILQFTMRWKALAKIYTMHSFAPPRKKPLQRSGSRPKIQEGAARKESKVKQTALRERGVRRSRIGAKDAIHAAKRFYA